MFHPTLPPYLRESGRVVDQIDERAVEINEVLVLHPVGSAGIGFRFRELATGPKPVHHVYKLPDVLTRQSILNEQIAVTFKGLMLLTGMHVSEGFRIHAKPLHKPGLSPAECTP
jgi:hypothetical protein